MASVHITAGDQKTFSFHITNCTNADAVWFASVVSIFCDPAKADTLSALRSGHAYIGINPRTGQACHLELDTIHRATIANSLN